MRETQCSLILEHLRARGTITHLEAETEYGIARLASRINDLRKMGLVIESKMVAGQNRRGEPTRYAEYRLVEDVR